MLKDFKLTHIVNSSSSSPTMILSKGSLVSRSLSLSSLSLTSPQGKNIEDHGELPYDVLDILLHKLDCDDLFQFAGVCKSWRAFHKIFWRNFLKSQAPLLVQISPFTKKTLSFFSIADNKFYGPEEKADYFRRGLYYVGSSSGYLIMLNFDDGSLILINPFTRRRRKKINISTSQLCYLLLHVLFAFVKGSQEFVLVVICGLSESLYVYHSRNSSWVTYSTRGKPWKVVDFVVLNKSIYVITDEAKIGVLSLNSTNIKFLELKNTPVVNSHNHLKLVNCDGKLLIVDFRPNEVLHVYQVNFLTMSFSKMETLGDIALFYGSAKSCHALSNPGKWGYTNNSLYFLSFDVDEQCQVYSVSGDDNKLQKYIFPISSEVPRSELLWHGWYFRHLHDEIDSSLVE